MSIVITLNNGSEGKIVAHAETHSDIWQLALEARESISNPKDWTGLCSDNLPDIIVRFSLPTDDLKDLPMNTLRMRRE